MWQQFNYDTCPIEPEAPCSGSGYPAYVINATTAMDVKKGIDFGKVAKENPRVAFQTRS
jgi:hypothetical protein